MKVKSLRIPEDIDKAIEYVAAMEFKKIGSWNWMCLITEKSFYGMDRANFIAALICSIFSFRRRAILSINNSFRIVTMVSKFTTHLLGRPSSGSRATSTGIPLIVEVTSATVTAFLTA